MEQTRLNLACGHQYLPGFINIDNDKMYDGIKIDKKADVTKLKWKKNSIATK